MDQPVLPVEPPGTAPVDAGIERVEASSEAVVLSAGFFERSMVWLTPRAPLDRGDSTGTAEWWASSDSAVVAVDGRGLARGLRPGVAWVHWGQGALRDSVLVEVRAPRSAPRVIAHRGFALAHPENTLVAFEESFRAGADAIELDLQLSRDGVFVVMHDATVDRTTDGRGTVGSLSAAELARLNACEGRADGSRCPVPTLREVLELVRKARGRALVEPKFPLTAELARRLVSEVEAAAVLHRVMFVSFDASSVARLREQSALVHLGLVSGGRRPLADFSASGAAALLWRGLWLDLVNEANPLATVGPESGLERYAWTITDTAQAPALLRAGVRHLISDVPLPR